MVTLNNAIKGLKVIRGRNWDWGNQDKGSNYGTLIGPTHNEPGWWDVKWENDTITRCYRVGDKGCFDLYYLTESYNIKDIEKNLKLLELKYK